MNILYGVQGTGNGHIGRSREIIRLLRKENTVEVLFSGRKQEDFFDIEDFKPYTILDGLTFKTKNGEIDYIETIKQLNFSNFYNDIISYKKDHDLIITDFEPITARIAKERGIKSIGLAHQYCFKPNFHDKLDIFSETIINNFAPANIEIGIHWWNFNKNIIPPIISNDIKKLKGHTIKNQILVYLPWMDISEFHYLYKYLDYTFIVYDKRIKTHKNIIAKQPSRKNFIKDLKSSEGVISNAGFQLTSEALFMGKKIIVLPIKKQSEQKSNAKILRELNLGMSVNSLNNILIDYWLKTPNNSKTRFKNSSKKFVEWINSGYQDVSDLVENVWY